MSLVELAHLVIGAPTQIVVAGLTGISAHAKSSESDSSTAIIVYHDDYESSSMASIQLQARLIPTHRNCTRAGGGA